MAIDTPAKIAILGAGPIGLEAALYARYLGYESEIYEIAATIAPRVLARGDVKMVTPFGMNRSSLGLSALRAQDSQYAPPPDDAFLTYAEWHAYYLQPLANTDLLADGLRLNTWVKQIGKVELTKLDMPSGEYDRGSWDFRLLVDHQGRSDEIVLADAVLDCSGWGDTLIRLPLGHGGIMAIGEDYLCGKRQALIHDESRIPDMTNWAGKSILLVGNEFSAAYVAQGLKKLIEKDAGTRVVWVTTGTQENSTAGPLAVDVQDPLLGRVELLSTANAWAKSRQVTWWPETWIEALEVVGDRLRVTFGGAHEETHEFDHLLNHNGCIPSHGIAAELVLDLCPRSEAPRPFAEALWKRKSPQQVEYPATSPAELITSEPNYYILGAKSFGRLPGFLFTHGLQQIRDVFTILGDRVSLDLYARHAT